MPLLRRLDLRACAPVVFASLTCALALGSASLAEPRGHCLDEGPLPSDPSRVESFVAAFEKSTFRFSSTKRDLVLDERIAAASLGLGDTVAALERLSPSADDDLLGAGTGPRTERRIERLILSVPVRDLARLKFELDYDGDYKDLEEYVFHDLDDPENRDPVLAHFETTASLGVKVLTDVDDTLYANLVDRRYPKGTLYPGILEFYKAVAAEPFELARIPITTLSARPNPIGGRLEEGSLAKLAQFTGDRLCPTGLSGSLASSALGTAETLARANLDLLSDLVPDGKEREIGETKYRNFERYAAIYPDYRFVFVGDSGQADALTASLMVSDSTNTESRVVTTFIHDLRTSASDTSSASPSFLELPAALLVSTTSSSGRGVIVFRNYIHAAALAHRHGESLGDLIDDRELLAITRAALDEFGGIEFESPSARRSLRDQYRDDAGAAIEQVALSGAESALDAEVRAIRLILEGMR